MKSKFLIFLLILLFVGFAYNAQAAYKHKYSVMLGMESATIAENESSLEQTDNAVQVEAEASESTAVTSMNIRLDYSFYNRAKWESYFSFSAPVMSSAAGSLWSGEVGFNYYFMGDSSVLQYRSTSAFFSSHSTLSCYAGSSFGVGYIVYQSVSKKSADFAFNLGAHAGVEYAINKKWGIKTELGMARWIGAMSSSMGMRMFAGVVSSL